MSKKKKNLCNVVGCGVVLVMLLSGCGPWWVAAPKQSEGLNSTGQTVIQDPNATKYLGAANLAKYEADAKSKPNDYETQFEAGQAAFVNQKYETAISYFGAAIKADPNRPDAYNDIGNIYLRSLNQPNKALTFYQKTVKVKPDFAYGWWNLALCQKQLGNVGDARESLEKGLKSVSKNDKLYTVLQKMLQQL